MTLETAKMIEEKTRFVRGIEALLVTDDRNMVDSLNYRLELQGEDPDVYDEYIDIIWTTGNHKRLLVTGNSNGANLMQITREVY